MQVSEREKEGSGRADDAPSAVMATKGMVALEMAVGIRSSMVVVCLC